MSLTPSVKTLKLLADETRIKILRIAREGEFTVNEFVEILSLHQSNISRHLNQLKEADLLSDRKEGNLNFYRCSESLKADQNILGLILSAFEGIGDSASTLNFTQQILNERKQKNKTFFDKMAGKYRNLVEPGGGYAGLFEGLATLLIVDTAVDIGCGEGELSLALSSSCQKIYAVDLSEEMLKVVDQRAKEKNLENLITKRGDLENLPFEEEEADLVILSQVLHHAANPENAITESLRVLRKGGKLMILDLQDHNLEWMREEMGDLWLGFPEKSLRDWIQKHKVKTQTFKGVEVANSLPLWLIILEK